MTTAVSTSELPASGSEPPVGGTKTTRPAPTGTTVLFALLVSTVLVTGSIIFMFLWNVVPPHGDRLGAVMNSCYARVRVLSQSGRTTFTPERIAQLNDALNRAGRCVQPILLEQASWAVYGTGILLAVAGLIYWSCPRWFIRRHGLTPILHEDCPELMEYLVGLAQTAGLDRVPVFLIAPYAKTSGGLAFGRFRRRYVQLDAGLLGQYTTDRAKFRAVVMHELAHLRNRDVDTTYLTMSIWWSFVAVALVPMVVVTLHPRLLTTPLRWQPPNISNSISLGLALLVLTGLMYLTRNAILRVREVHADARAAEDDESGGGLRAVVGELRTPDRWRAMIGTHPHPRRRIQAIDNPAAMLSPRLWELFVAGLATAMIAVNLCYVFSQALQTLTVLSLVSAGIVCVPGLVAPLILTVWRTAARTPSRRLPLRTVLPMPVVLIAGFLLGEQLSFFSTYTQWTGLVSGGLWQPLIAAFLLLSGAVTLTVWTASVAHGVLGSTGHGPRWALPVVGAAGVIAFALWFGEWNASHASPGMVEWITGGSKPPPGSPGWYIVLAEWVDLTSPPLIYLIYSPLTLPGLALLWLVPIVLAARRRRAGPESDGHPYRIGGALLSGLVAAVVFTLVGVVLTYVLKAALPISVRGGSGVPYTVHSMYFALAVLAQAGVATVIAAWTTRHRPVLIPLAVFVTGLLATGITQLGLFTLVRCIDLYGGKSPTCFRMPEAKYLTDTLHIVLVKGMIAAVPAALLGAAIGALIRRLRGPADPGAPERHQRDRGRVARAVPAAALTLITVAVIIAALVEAPSSYSMWID